LNCLLWCSHLSGAIVDEQSSESPEGGSSLHEEVEVTSDEKAIALGSIEVIKAHSYLLCS
jgi:hypothetical protein